MRIAVIGCGGVGGVVAANLLRAGEEVTPIVRTREVAETLARNGLTVRELDGRTWTVRASSPPLLDPGEVPGGSPSGSDHAFDLAILATQSTALEGALRAVLPLLAQTAPIVTCQNGLPEERARAVLVAAGEDPDRVVGCVVGWGASMTAPGVYQRTSRGGIQLGGTAAQTLAVSRALRPLAELSIAEDLAGVRWSKLAINCVTSTLGALGGLPLGQLLTLRHVRRLALEVFTEVGAVAKAGGVRVQPVGGTFPLDAVSITPPERARPFGSPSLAFKHSLLLAVGFKYRRMRSSMLYALERGRPLEIEHLNGEIVRRGAALGIPTPVNEALLFAVRSLERHESQPDLEQLRRIHGRLRARTAPRASA